LRVLILTQNDNLYLPTSMAHVCEHSPEPVVCIVSAPAMSTHGGPVRGFIRHLRLFGLWGTAVAAKRVLTAKVRGRLGWPGRDGPFHSLRAVARAFDIPYHEVDKVASDAFHAILDEYKPDLLVSMSCPQIIGKKVRDRLPKGCINVHGAPLPHYRGLMPAFWVLRNGETSTAATVHDLADRLDNGDILIQREVPVEPDDTWASLVGKTKSLGAEILVEAVSQIADGNVQRKPNLDEDATYFSFPTATDRKAFRASGRRFF